jgi:hypothetical protein
MRNDYRSYTNDDFMLHYPKSWKEHDDHGFLAFSPKSYLKKDKNIFENILTIFKLDHERYKGKTIDSLIEDNKKQAVQFNKQTKLTIRKDSTVNGEVVIVKMDKQPSNGSDMWPNIELKHYYKHNSIIYEICYDVIMSDYDISIKDAMVIFNSFEFVD